VSVLFSDIENFNVSKGAEALFLKSHCPDIAAVQAIEGLLASARGRCVEGPN
jgi:hypothetical protein